MAVEIELKAHVRDPRGPLALKAEMSLLAPPPLSFEKDDCYWVAADYCPPASVSGAIPKSGVRLRRESTRYPDGGAEEKTLVTYKSKEVREGIEINDEREFTVSDGDTFGELLKRLGLEPGVRKHKQGWAFTFGNIYAELAEVSGGVSGNTRNLGWFLELEILANEAGAETVAAARKELLGLLEKLNVGKECIEERYYSEMLGDGELR
jgi:adenylate cyclase class 2